MTLSFSPVNGPAYLHHLLLASFPAFPCQASNFEDQTNHLKTHLTPDAQGPDFLNLGASKAIDGNPRPGHLFASRGNALKIAFVRTTSCPASHYLVPVSDGVLNNNIQIRECGEKSSGELLSAFAALNISIGGVENGACGEPRPKPPGG